MSHAIIPDVFPDVFFKNRKSAVSILSQMGTSAKVNHYYLDVRINKCVKIEHFFDADTGRLTEICRSTLLENPGMLTYPSKATCKKFFQDVEVCRLKDMEYLLSYAGMSGEIAFEPRKGIRNVHFYDHKAGRSTLKKRMKQKTFKFPRFKDYGNISPDLSKPVIAKKKLPSLAM